MMWSNFYLEGGFGMLPTTLFGFSLVAAGALYLLRPEKRFYGLLLSLGLLNLVSGLLGTTVGVINTFHYLERVAPAEQFKLTALGCAESLNNMVLAFIFLALTLLLVAIGAYRAARRKMAE